MFCMNCGKQLDEGTKLCLFCGTVQDIAEDIAQGTDSLTDSLAEPEVFETTEPTTSFSEGSVLDSLINEQDSFASAESEESQANIQSEETPNDLGGDLKAEAANGAPVVKAKKIRADRPRKKPMGVAASVVLCVLFSMITLVFSLTTTSLWTVRSALQSGSVSAAAKKANVLNLKAKDIISDTDSLEATLSKCGIAKVDFGEISDDETVGDLIDRSFVEYGLSEEDAEKFLENSELMPYVAEVVSCYETYLLTGEDTRAVSDKKIKETAVSCMEYASEELGFQFQKDYEQRLDSFLSENRDLIKSANPTEALGVGGSYIRYAFSLPVIGAAGVLTLLFAVLVGIITRRADMALASFGIPMFISGLAFLYLGLFPKLVLESADIPSAAVGDSVEMAFGGGLISAGIIETAIGLLLIAAFIVYRVIAVKIAKKKVLQSANS